MREERCKALRIVTLLGDELTKNLDCIRGGYELASLRDEDTGKGYCPAGGKDHLELNTGIACQIPRLSKFLSMRREAAAPPPCPLLRINPDACGK